MSIHLLEIYKTWANRCAAKHWAGQRSAAASVQHLGHFIKSMAEMDVKPTDITREHVAAFTLGMQTRGLSASTINTRLSCIKTFLSYFADVLQEGDNMKRLRSIAEDMPWATRSKNRNQWHMTDAHWATLIACRTLFMPGFLQYIEWTMETGLRVEETLRLLPADFDGLDGERPALTVPGTKNEHSKVRVPISNRARDIIIERMNVEPILYSTKRLFDFSYKSMMLQWEKARKLLGVTGEPTATLKSLRRTFAARALRKGLPARIIQELMRHSNLETTMGYLKLIGMSDNDETRALINRQLGEQRAKEQPFVEALGAELSKRFDEGFIRTLVEGVSAASPEPNEVVYKVVYNTGPAKQSFRDPPMTQMHYGTFIIDPWSQEGS